MNTDIHIISNQPEKHLEIISKLEEIGYLFLDKEYKKVSNEDQYILIFSRKTSERNLDTLKENIQGELNNIIPNLYSDIEIKVSY
ncbi:hypothetical protein EIM44_02935 [Bibersteinia trehalosi]|uniref:Uncharacterized protein n=1 Tax=Bibersteinia trehalosi TaxID=47735 RepID=A0A426FIN0_BIBTR|nr:hypothetical protein [Bibersteinia trehalosi]RRN04414.1 hypothetical protein EIM44_02935 [Bibersteinia trehalosi]